MRSGTDRCREAKRAGEGAEGGLETPATLSSKCSCLFQSAEMLIKNPPGLAWIQQPRAGEAAAAAHNVCPRVTGGGCSGRAWRASNGCQGPGQGEGCQERVNWLPECPEGVGGERQAALSPQQSAAGAVPGPLAPLQAALRQRERERREEGCGFLGLDPSVPGWVAEPPRRERRCGRGAAGRRRRPGRVAGAGALSPPTSCGSWPALLRLLGAERGSPRAGAWPGLLRSRSHGAEWR